ncbi:MAG: hypothetical protein NW207_00665 [Cytophagales bacterium]|nr:hypothetical protein [Cytophagales bacterium]
MSKKAYIIFIISILSVYTAVSQNIDISQNWKFEFGDNVSWAQLSTDDNNWKTMPKLGIVEDLGYPDFKGFAWFRKKVVIPSSFKANALKYGYINLVLGGIDDSDQGFFNGKMVGESGKLPPDSYIQGFYTFRMYKINPNEVLWDKENIIAVRLYDHLENGGFYKGPYLICVPNDIDFRPAEKEVPTFTLPKDYEIWTKNVQLPANLKTNAAKNNGLILNTNLPGNVKFFINDKLITESNTPNAHRIFVPNTMLKWTPAETLTIYLAKNNPKDEIMFSKLTFEDAGLSDMLYITNKSGANSDFVYDMEVINHSNIDITGTMSLELVSDTYKIEDKILQPLTIVKGGTKILTYKFKPAFSGAYFIHYKIIDTAGNILMGSVAKGFAP